MECKKLPKHCIIAESLAYRFSEIARLDIKKYRASLFFQPVLKSIDCEYIEYPFNSKIYGFTMADEYGSSITINSNIENSRYNFTMAHELGHLLLHVRNGIVTVVDTNDTLNDDINIIETEANQFAAHFLLPDYSLRSQIMSGYTLFNIKKNSDVSLDTVKWRIINFLKRYNFSQGEAIKIYSLYADCRSHTDVRSSTLYEIINFIQSNELTKEFGFKVRHNKKDFLRDINIL